MFFLPAVVAERVRESERESESVALIDAPACFWQCVAVFCSVLQSVAVCCSGCSVLQCVTVALIDASAPFLHCSVFVCRGVLQSVAECCSVLQSVAK